MRSGVRGRALTVVIALLVLSGFPVSGQAPNDRALSFEVASVKPTTIAGTSVALMYPGRFHATNMTLQGLLARAWGLREDQVEGGAAWLRADGFDVEAKADGTPAADRMWLMLRTLLAERFKLMVRTETKSSPVFELVLAQRDSLLGPGLRPSSGTNCTKPAPATTAPAVQDATHPYCGVLYSPIGHWTGRAVPMATVATALGRMLGRSVIDRTDASGTFDLDLEWTDLAALFAPAGPQADVQPPRADGPSLFTALQEQLGLKLNPTRGAVDILVIEHAERPTAN
jgi:uncharacterized protein (TIGR03435 family)